MYYPRICSCIDLKCRLCFTKITDNNPDALQNIIAMHLNDHKLTNPSSSPSVTDVPSKSIPTEQNL